MCVCVKREEHSRSRAGVQQAAAEQLALAQQEWSGKLLAAETAKVQALAARDAALAELQLLKESAVRSAEVAASQAASAAQLADLMAQVKAGMEAADRQQQAAVWRH